ncbi:MAG TPA: S8 family serine peptidase [Candidatus Limnocylindrales bacterium]|nr:S8 family serine peptidase [Candidatus Limnocylindrales bacterium]
MRRLLTAIAAASMLVSSVGSALAVEPVPSTDPGPTVEPSPIAPSASAEPTSVAEPLPSADPETNAGAVAPTTAPSTVGKTAPAVAGSADPSGRWIVVLKDGTNAATTVKDRGRKLGFKADRTFSHAFRGFSAKLDRGQVDALRRDASVAMVVPDEKIEAEAQSIPTGISRMGARVSPVARINGIDERIDADVAIVDTGITQVADLNVVGGYNCSTTNRAAWRDVYGHGTHVAGTVGAIDNADGVVGVAPGVRLWAVKILDDSGEGLLSWYVCGLDWIAAQRDPTNPSRPLIEAVNMSVTKWGKDDGNCGNTNKDILHQAICRLVASGVTVAAAAANDSSSAAARVPAAYNEVITVSALADTDGKPGSLGGHRCLSWGTYDADDTFADFSNYGSDVDLIAPGKCIWSTVPGGFQYMSGTSMATPHVTGAVALVKSTRPYFTTGEVKEALQYLGNLGWKTNTDPDPYHEKLLDVSRLGPRGDFSLASGTVAAVGEGGGSARLAVAINRSTTSFERVRLSFGTLPAGMTGSFDKTSVYGFGTTTATLTVNVPQGTARGTYAVTVTGDEHGNRHAVTSTFVVKNDIPTALPPTMAPRTKATTTNTTVPVQVSWAAGTDPTSAIGGYEVQRSINGGGWTALGSTAASVRGVATTQTLGSRYQYRVRARDVVGNWSAWAAGPILTGSLVQERSSVVVYHGTWRKTLYSLASGGSTTYATATGARARMTFSGRAIAIVAPVGPTRGTAAVYVDGVYKRTVSFRATSGRSRMVMYSTTFAAVGSHSIELRLTTSKRVDLDAFVILR